MGIFGQMREAVFGKPMETSEQRIARAQAEEERRIDAINRRRESGAVDSADAGWRAADKGHGEALKAEMNDRAEVDAGAAEVAAEEAQREAA